MRLQLVMAAAVFGASLSANATTLATATGGSSSSPAQYIGQSFNVTGSGLFDDITFNFYGNPSTTAPLAAGNGYLFAAPYTGTPSGLNSGDAGLLGMATSSGGVYSFAPSLTLIAGEEYYFYEDASVPNEYSGNDAYTGGNAYMADSSSSGYTTSSSLNFLVTGEAVSATPEPSSLVLLGTGLLGIVGMGLRRRSWLG